ncbi:hypothetical protein [Burkholderia gladioli]|uniref:hypothetical protein n=1 Tax=Burkholderia gladioli TaxID=28095 RepID=UPI002FE11F3B
MKHPLTIYQLSLDRIAAAWLRIFPLLDRMETEVALGRSTTDRDEILEAYEALVSRLNEHVDACEEALRSLRPPIPGKIHKFHWQFLDATGLPGWGAFKDEILKKYRDPLVGMLVNEIKHASGHLTLCNAQTVDGPVVGFFLNGAFPGGAIGPNKKLHQPFGSMLTAFSFRRDMMMHFWWVYQIGEAVAKCVEQTIETDQLKKVGEVKPANASPDWSRLVEKCAGLKGAFFPDENAKARPIIVVPKDAASISIKLAPPRVSGRSRPMNVRIEMAVHEGTPSYVMPYFLGENTNTRR